MTLQTAGIHHITAFVGDAQRNVDFYAGILGLRLVKKTINFDAPEVYHLYFGDEIGNPGTIITFFPWPMGRKGRIGGGQVGVTTYAMPPGSMGFWEERLEVYQIQIEKSQRFSETYISFTDYDGLQIEMVEREEGSLSTWSFADIPVSKAIKGFGGAGTVHHIAWRTKDDQEQLAWRRHVESHGYQPTPVQDRQYFNAVYFREEGGMLFEIATDPPGFARDEEVHALGEKLMLPEWYESDRSQIESNLVPSRVRIPEVGRP